MAVGRDIPEDVKREVRQRCKFGCVFCGLPVFDYDHLVEWSECREHDPDNINLLCPNHHRARKNGLSAEAIRKAAANPWNARKDRTTAHSLELVGGGVVFDIGGNIFIADMLQQSAFAGLLINRVEQFGAREEDGWLKINLRIANQWGRTLLEITEGELTVSTHVWDFSWVGEEMTIRSGLRSVMASLGFGAGGIKVRRGFFADGKKLVRVEPNVVTIQPDVFYPPMARVERGSNSKMIGGFTDQATVGMIV